MALDKCKLKKFHKWVDLLQSETQKFAGMIHRYLLVFTQGKKITHYLHRPLARAIALSGDLLQISSVKNYSV